MDTKLHTLFLLLFTIAINAQATEHKTNKDSLYYASYEKLKIAYIAQQNTFEARNYKKLSGAFNSKWQFADKREHGEKSDDMQWIKANLTKTKFSSWDEVILENDAITKAYTALLISSEGQYFNKLSDELENIYGPFIMTDVVNEVDFGIAPSGPHAPEEELHPTGNTDSPEFKEKYKKLNELAVASFKAPAVANARKLNKEFNAKWKYAYTADKNSPPGFDDRLEWLQKHWKKTKFKSFAEAKKEYETLLYAELQAGESEESKAYTNYLLKMVRMYDAHFYADHLKELKKNYPDIYYPTD